MDGEGSQTASHDLTERDNAQKEAMEEVDNQANMLLSNNVRTEEDNSKIPVTHRANISNITLYTPTTGMIVKNFDMASNHYGIDIQNKKLANENFVKRAPESVVNVEREKKAKFEALIVNLNESLKNLGI